MYLGSAEEVNCPIRDILGRVGARWSLDVMVTLLREPCHFAGLERAIHGVSRRMLVVTVRALERDGLVARTPAKAPGGKVVYALTPLGVTLAERLDGLARWSQQHRDAIYAARERFDAAQNGAAELASIEA